MSDLPPPPPPPPPPGAAPTTACPTCGAPVTPDQDWCLNCGAAVSTEVAAAAGWRTPIVIVATVLVLAAIGLVVAFLALSGEADDVATRPAASATPAPPPTGPTGPTGATVTGITGPSGPTGPSGVTGPVETATPVPTTTPTGSIPNWPDGKHAYTVILFSETSYASAKSKAQTVSSLSDVGILRSGKFSSLRSGYFVVFSGQYDTLKQAQAAVDDAQSQAPSAYAKEVTPK